MPKPARIIAIDKETGSIHDVVNYDPTNKDPKSRCILRQRLFYVRYRENLTKSEKDRKIGYSFTYQLLEKLEFFIVKPRK